MCRFEAFQTEQALHFPQQRELSWVQPLYCFVTTFVSRIGWLDYVVAVYKDGLTEPWVELIELLCSERTKMGHNKWWLLAVSSVALSACGSAVSYSRTATSPAYAPPSTASNSHVIPSLSIIKSRYGEVLGSQSGYAYYIFQLDSPTRSNCDVACAAIWPPVIGASHVVSGNIRKSLVGSITRSNGAKQLTYDGHPLYSFAGDTTPGSTAGQALYSFGAYWYLIAPNGHVITGSAKPSSSTTGS